MTDPAFPLPEDLADRLRGDYSLSVARLIAGRTQDPLSFFMELDDLIDIPSDQLVQAFERLLADFQGRLSSPKESSSDDTVFL